MKTLHLTLKKKWFDMILTGEKKEEYREIKPYWIKRIASAWNFLDSDLTYWENGNEMFESVEFDVIIFKNGYSKNAPEMEIECKGIEMGLTKSHWCDDGEKKVFVIMLGKILFHKNCN